MKRNKKGFTMAKMLIKAEAVSFSLPAAAFARTGD